MVRTGLYKAPIINGREVLTKPEMGISCFLFVDLFPIQLLQVWKVSEIDDIVIIIPYK